LSASFIERAPATSGPRTERFGRSRPRTPKSARGVLAGVVLATTSLLTARSAYAEPPAAVEVSPPTIRSAPDVTLPPGETPSEPVAVELELAIDQQGVVTSAAVVASAGPAFDQAALEAAKKFEFEPARRGTEPLAVTIRYRYVFPAAPPPAPPAVAEEPSGVGHLPSAPKPAAERAPAPAAPPPPSADADVEEFEATAEVQAPPRETTKRTVEREELTRVPGTRGDALRAIEVLPGVARTGVDDGTPILRGAGQDESLSYLDGVPVPFLYHFGGVTSFFNSRLLSRVELYPGNFSTRYGRAVGGVIDVRTREPAKDRFHGVLDLSLIDTSIYAETPIGSQNGFALAARRSNIDLVYSKIVPKDAFSVVAAPTYYDYQGIYAHAFGSHRLKVLGYGSRDAIELVFSNPSDQDPGLMGGIKGALSFHRLQAELKSEFTPNFTQDVVVAVGRIDAEQRIGELYQEYGGLELHGRAEWGLALHPAFRVTTGADFFGWFLEGSYRGPVPTQYEGNPRQGDGLAAQRLVYAKTQDLDVIRPGAYLELAVRPVESLTLLPGVRGDYYGEFDAWSVDPRVSARFQVASQTTLKAGFGRYSQPAQFWMAIPQIGNPDLEAYSALQTSAGIEQGFSKNLEIGVEAFHKKIDDVVVGSVDGSRPGFVNDGRGRIIGAEFSAEARPDERTFGYLAYTLSRSERSDHGGPYRLFDRDQTHILSLAASRKLGAGWELGARFRLVSGEPTTPVTGSVFDARTGVYLPQYGAVNSVRNPTFHQLDVKVEKAFRIGALTLAPYLDVQNVYNAKNAEGYSYNYDYTKREQVSGLGLFPNLGVRGEL
jgi:TonB family protein